MAPSPAKILIVALILLLLFGATRLTEIGKGIGEGIRNFKKGMDPDSDKNKQVREEPKRLPQGEGSPAETSEGFKKESA